MVVTRFLTRLVSLVFIAFHAVTAQEIEPFRKLTLIEPRQLQQDFDQLVEIMQQHPARTVFTPEEKWKQIISEQKALLTTPMTVAQFFDVCAQVTDKIRCGHTGLDLPGNFWKKGDQAAFPLPVAIINDSLFVVRPSTEISNGAQIVRINGTPLKEILDRLQTYISADGMNTTWKIGRLNQNLNNFISLRFNFARQYEVVFRNAGNSNEKTVTLPARRSDELSQSTTKSDPLTYKVMEPKQTAVIGVHSFNYYRKDSSEFFHAMNDFFARAHADGIQKLILDLRGNTGGDPFCAAHLLSYLENKPFIYYGEVYDWCPNLAQPYPLKAKRFKGDLYVLVDGLCFSTTGHLLSLMKFNNVGTIIGEESGGTYTCNDSGKWYELKNSDLKLRMARQSFRTTADSLPREKGVLPDHEVKVSSQSIINGKDPVLEYALALTR